MHNYGDDILERLTLDKFLAELEDEQSRDILKLWLYQELTWEEIGKVIGIKYKDRTLTGSVMRYHRNRVLAELRAKYESQG